MQYGSQQQLDWVPEMMAYGMDWADVYLGLRGARNPFEYSNVSSERVTAHKRAMGTISGMRTEKTRWVLVRVPSESLAQQAEMSLDDIMAFFFAATLRDWSKEATRYQEIRQVFQQSEQVRITGRDTDLTFSTRGRIYEAADGHLNMPDGEIFTSPLENSIDGRISFEFPGIYAGKKVEGISLEFSRGRLIRASARTNEDLLHSLLKMDEGASRVGEFGLGANFGIDHFMGDILYDEKIGGTIHIAMGRAYKECGGTNQSALHWDIIKDLRQGGAVTLDGKKVLEDGKFLI
jgi:aminopeptidase